MNYKMSAYILGAALRLEAVFMLIPMAISIREAEHASARAFGIASIVTMALSFLLSRRRPQNTSMYAREGFSLVALCWISFSLCGALPYFISGVAPNFVAAVFESVSGFTTTGASVFWDIEVLPRGILFWRGFTVWLGGMGVLVLILSYLPASGGHLVHIMRAESPGPAVGKMLPRLAAHTKALYLVYIALTFLQVIFLMSGGMPVFDSVIHAFTTAGTGGFSVKNASIGFYNSAYIEWVIVIFMILFGTNLMIFYMALFKRVWGVMRNEEIRAYFIIILASVALITLNLLNASQHGFDLSLREAVFNTVSFVTTTGFVTADFASWPAFSQIVLMVVMIIGTCTFSTGGGIKVSRMLIVAKSAMREIRRIVHPQMVTRVTLDRRPVEEHIVLTVNAFFALYIGILVMSTVLLTLVGNDLPTAYVAAVSTLGNTGPGANFLGPVQNYTSFGVFSQLVLILNMLFGRLEIFPLLVLFSPANLLRRGSARAPGA